MKKLKLKERIKTDKQFRRIIIAVIAVILIPFSISFSKFVTKSTTEHYLKSKGFYFYSNALNGSTYNLNAWNGIDNYTFSVDVNNGIDELTWTNENIPYITTVTCTSENGDVLCSSDAPTGTILNNGISRVTQRIGITLDRNNIVFNEGDSVNVNVKVKSTTPYEKEMSANFLISVNDTGISYSVEDASGSDYLSLIISNSSMNNDITVNWNEALLNIDNTSYFVQSGTASTNQSNIINQLQFTIPADNVVSLRFYKTDVSADYSLNTEVISIS